jgi:dolichol-phosphate mannosyltransferase
VHYELAVVMPVYNEQDCVAGVVRSWQKVLSDLGIRFVIFALNDGSKDGTAAVLGTFAGEDTVRVINKPNSGHGPTILQGYREAVKVADWVFQCDSDDEMKAAHFPNLWNQRANYDALFGSRAGRIQSWGRRVLSAGSRWAVRTLFAPGVSDVNTAYRLMRSSLLAQIVWKIPDRTFAPNVIISGALGKAGARIHSIPVPFEPRQTGTVSIGGWKLLKIAGKCAWQTLACRPKIDLSPPSSATTPGTPSGPGSPHS